MKSKSSQITVLDFGGQYSHLIKRRILDMGVGVNLIPANNVRKEDLNTRGVIFSGGPRSVDSDDSVKIPSFLEKFILNPYIPILGICYGHQLLGHILGGKLSHSQNMEYGREEVIHFGNSSLLSNISNFEVWMSHGDSLLEVGPDFIVTASTENCPVTMMEHKEKAIFGVQFHPEVSHTQYGNDILSQFVIEICKAEPTSFDIGEFCTSLVDEMKSIIGSKKVLLGVSGGVDSTVTALLLQKAIGTNLHCVFIDHGLLRKDESQEVQTFFTKTMNFENFTIIDSSSNFIAKLSGIKDPEDKRKLIGHTFIEVFEETSKMLEKTFGNFEFLAQGTIFTDRIESGAVGSNSAKIKSHHNLTLPHEMKLQIIEPLKELYKDEVRELGVYLGAPKHVINRYPFPGPGLAIRIIGEVTKERLKILQKADDIFIQEIYSSDVQDMIWQGFAVLLPINAVGVKGDKRSYGQIIALRAVESREGMSADFVKLPWEFLGKVATRIINEMQEITRVLYDISTKPPATIEFE